MTITANRQNVTGNAGRVGAVIATAIALCALSAAAQTAKEVKGTTPLVAVPNEAPPKLIVDPPIPEQLALGRVFIGRLTENLRVLPVRQRCLAVCHASDTFTTTWMSSRGLPSTRAGRRWSSLD
jgi:hypothetical protein